MGEQRINVTKENYIATVQINNPPANTLSSACIAELRNVFCDLAVDKETRAIVLTGAGRFFVAGADIKEFVDALGNEKKGMEMAAAGQALCNEIEAMKKPVIAAINGPCLGGGMELAMGCHYRIAAPDAILGLPELKLGLLPSFGGTQRLSRITSPATALELILQSKQLSGTEAAQLGIVQQVVSKEELLPTAISLAKSFIDGKSMTSVTRVIECITMGSKESLETGLERERQYFGELFLTDDAKEGINAFIEKRQPSFKHS
ncbi:enoyl-CoA hydratase-related protein [Bacillus chungangensis]|uniref:Enoyl-CoA hydratase n=1 Tax=Bacillus chungangensis TaxID=587633 RepID=A0ABT9WQY3_9BACI|nr:enoyl-CoA hydratase-related protein [Bacillus chungangensis]MDQ0175548.1 enoyl-CoA hydratase [Bacillus chungangensis]